MGKNSKEVNKSGAKKDISVRFLVLSVFFWLLTVTWILLIFILSSEDGTASNNTSALVQSYTTNIIKFDVFSNTSIRTLGHVCEFGVLTLLSFFAIDFTNRISKKGSYAESPLKIIKSDNDMNIIFTLWFALINALADEYHQLFVTGRTGTIGDVVKDALGILLVLAIIRLVFSIYLSVKGRKEVRYN